MTFFRCETCKCCQEGCKYLKPGCLKATFSGFDAEADVCVECDKFDTYSLVMRRDELQQVTATATAVRVDGDATPAACTDAEFTVTLQQNELGTYTVELVVIDYGGSCYRECTELNIVPNGGWIGCDRPVFTLEIGRDQPQVEASVAGGAGASLEVFVAPLNTDTGEETWEVSAVSVESAGTGYSDGQTVAFTVQDGEEVSSAAATIQVAREEPFLVAQVGGEYSYGSATLSQTTDENGRPAWQATGVEVYAYPLPEVGDPVTFTTSGVTLSPASATVSSVDGGVVSVTITDGGLYYQTDGSIESVVVTNGGEYFRGGAIKSVTILDGGRIYPHDPCRYISAICGDCPSTSPGRPRKATLTFGEAGSVSFRLNTMSAVPNPPWIGGSSYVDSTIELEASITGWDGTFPIEFPPESFTNYSACTTPGTLTITEASCDEYTEIGECWPLPEQIEVTFSNFNLLNGMPSGTCDDGSEWTRENWDCGKCNTSTDGSCLFYWVGWGSPTLAVRAMIENGTYVFDLVSPSQDRPVSGTSNPFDCEILYSGSISFGPLVIKYHDAPHPAVSCNEFELASRVDIRIAPTPCQPHIYIAPPSPPPPLPSLLCPAPTDCQTATAVVSSVVAGAVAGIGVVNGGSCYAWRTYTAREPAPAEVTLGFPEAAGTGAMLTPVWTQDGTGNEATFHVSDVTVEEGGTGYNDGDQVVATVHPGAGGVLVCSGAFFVGTVVTVKEEPEAEIVPAAGSGAVLEVVWSEITPAESQPECWLGWEVTSVTVADGGAGYVRGGPYSLDLGEDTVSVSSPNLRIITDAPDAEASASVSSGTGASLSVTLTLVDDEWQRYWYVSGVTVTVAGTGYTQGESVTFTADTGEITEAPAGHINVDQNGAITGVVIDYAGQIESNIGPIQSIEVLYGGVLHKKTGVIACIDIVEPGTYVAADPTGVESESPTVQVRSQCHSEYAEVEAEVDLDPESESFGAITGINIIDGGSGYSEEGIAWKLTIEGLGGFADMDAGHRTPGDMCFGPIPGRFDEVGGCHPTPRLSALAAAGGCPDVSEWYLPPSSRTTHECPAELLTRTYKMFLTGGSSFAGADCDGGAHCVHSTPFANGGAWVLIDAGNGDFECAINPA